jgi:hypothetical protein
VTQEAWGGQNEVDIAADSGGHGAHALFLLVTELFAMTWLVTRRWISWRVDLLVSHPVGLQGIFHQPLPD